MSSHVFEFYSIIYLNKIPFYGYNTFYSSIHQLLDIWVVFFFAKWTMLLWTIIINIFVWPHVFISLGNILKNCQIVFQITAIFSVSTTKVWGFKFLHILANTVTVCHFDCRYLRGNKAVSYCSLDLNFPKEWCCWLSSNVLISNLISSLEQCLFRFYAQFSLVIYLSIVKL